MDLPLLKNDITRFFIDVILVFYCRNQKIGPGCDIVLCYHRKFGLLIVTVIADITCLRCVGVITDFVKRRAPQYLVWLS
jgi:hypothetical protein